jgi:nucleoside-diphosphate-sugar epimerase
MNHDTFYNKKFLVTGATGLIGKAVVHTLLHLNELGANVQIVAQVHSMEKAERAFSPNAKLTYIAGDIAELPLSDIGVNYIIHGASITSSQTFVEKPVETILTSVSGSRRILEFARMNPVEAMVYLSSMEVYGQHHTDDKITESFPTNVDTMMARSSYPESKRLCESLCTSYFSEYGVPARVIRLTQTFGRGVEASDNRVFAEFAKCAIQGEDIILKTKGETRRSYLSVDDAVSAIFTVLEHGENGEAYNATNEDTYCSIYEMAQLVADGFSDGKSHVLVEKSDEKSRYFMPVHRMNLDTTKLRSLGWLPRYSLTDMYKDMIDDMMKHKTF